MNFIQQLIDRLNPIPPEYQHLAANFEAQGEAFIRRWLVPGALLGGLMTLAYLPLPYILYQEVQQTTLLLFSAVFATYVVVAAVVHFGGERISTYLTITTGWTTVSLLSFGVMAVTNDFTSASGILVLTVVAYAGLLPWPAKWTVWFFGLITLLYLAIAPTLSRSDNWIDYIIMGILLLLVIFIFGAAYALLVRLRWQNFLNEQLIKAATARLQEDLNVARQIQQRLMPPPNPNWPRFDLICYTAPAREVGGDLYSYHQFEGSDNPSLSQKYAVAVGDVSGKGLPAALLMATSLAHLNSLLEQPLSPAERLIQLDQAMIPYTQTTGHNCALCYVELSLLAVSQNGSKNPPGFRLNLRTVNAGCIPPYVKRADGSVEWLQVGGIPLGMGLGSQFGYPEATTCLLPGDLLILTSDGVPEASTVAEEVFGFERLQATIAGGPTTSAQAMLDHIKAHIDAFVGNAEPHDDLTIVVLRVLENSVTT